MASKLLEGRGADGIPLKSDYDSMAPAPQSLFVLYTNFFLVFSMFGVAAGVGLFYFTESPLMHKKIEIVKEFGMGPLYIALFFLKFVFQMVNANMGTTRRETKVNNPDQHIYRVYGGASDGSIVLMDLEGAHGRFNRGQRALANLEEYLPLFLVNFAFVGFVAPTLVAVITVLFGLARLKGAIAYVESAKDRTSGNLASFLMMGLIDGMALFIGVVTTFL